VDETIVITGSFNFTGNAQRSNDENVVILRSPALGRQYTDEFMRIYQLGTK
jgi:phosphatidylserine/phosphatidylglycerophosphate/cardiolipin synthase-like enzyme